MTVYDYIAPQITVDGRSYFNIFSLTLRIHLTIDAFEPILFSNASGCWEVEASNMEPCCNGKASESAHAQMVFWSLSVKEGNCWKFECTLMSLKMIKLQQNPQEGLEALIKMKNV